MHPLDQLETLDGYRQLFTSLSFWQGYVRQVCSLHGLSCTAVRTGIPGTCPVFIVDERWVVKFFGRLFDGASSFRTELAAAHLLAEQPILPGAALVASGSMAWQASDWKWPYLVFERVDGLSYGEAEPQLVFAEKLEMAVHLGGWLRALHALPLPADGPFAPGWEEFAAFLAVQRSGCAARHAAWGRLPPALISQLEAFLPDCEALLERSTRPHLIHADLTGDHLLGQVHNGRWRSLAIIDFGDARSGPLEYELVALHLDLFRGDRRLLGAFLRSYGCTPPAGFSRRMLAYTLLHQFDFSSLLPLQTCPASLEELAEQVWSVE